ncbi:Permease of the major facilitator superfamily [Candidatus Burkholderia verschuerenii]|uniref:Permease of the major facilitator superfamily n=1 Tax=Candidatus Burkholderia verschuerenii TaxID=242163 RepID=A0A0L0MG92_9BURK|nr:MFS transporter [Candidatus Burkholderia verschuerenii]KND61310.1 Permease of the major facilitator superfamily [Candidatus Burkholderia verschuerenii]
MTASSDFKPRSAWTMTILLTGLALINFLDKVVIGVVAVPMTKDLGLSHAQFGLVAGSFFWLFSLSTILVGLIANRVPTRWTLLAMGIAWAVLQIPQALTASVFALLMCRVLLGAAEGPFMPTTVHALYKWFPDKKRSLPVAIVSQGAGLGLLMAGLLIPLVTARYGWRTNFFLLGAVGVVWSVLWLCFGREGNLDVKPAAVLTQSAAPAPRRTLCKTFADPSVLCVLMLGFSAYWSLSLLFTWLPTYLEKGLGYANVEAGRLFALVIIAATPINLGLSWLSQTLLERGVGTRTARVKLISIAFLVSGVIYVLPLLIDLTHMQKVLLMAVGAGLPTVAFAIAPALLAEVVPDRQRGATLAFYTAIGSLGGAISPAVMGGIVQKGSSMTAACELGFATCSILVVLAALLALRWLNPDRSKQALAASAIPTQSSAA